MHDPIKEHLEDLLKPRGGTPSGVESHLANCGECREELAQMRGQSRLFDALRVPGIDPAPGFYARVIGRIEAQDRSSIWNVFTESPFGRRLAVASLTLALLLGAYLVSTEPGDRFAPSDSSVAIAEQVPEVPAIGSDTEQTRDTVLVNLSSYQE